MAIAGVVRPIMTRVMRRMSPGARKAVKGAASTAGNVATNPLVQGGVGLMTGGLPGAVAQPIVTAIAGKNMGTLAGLGVGALSAPLAGAAAGLVNRGVVQPITNTITGARREAGETALGGRGVGDPEAIIDNAGLGAATARESLLAMYDDPRYQAEARRVLQDTMTANNQKGQIRGALNRDQYLANTIDRGMAETGATMRQLLQSQNAYVGNF
jgi:hypothetical protein